MSWLRGIAGVALAAGLSVASTGCLKKVLIDGQVRGTRDGAPAVNTLQDYEVARAVARAGLGTLEGLYKLAPDNEDGLFLLTRSWAGATAGFTEDEWEESETGKDEVLSQYNRERTIAGFQRARFFGIQLLKQKGPGLEDAMRNADTMNAYLRENFQHREEAEDLLWAGFAWLGLVNAAKDNPALVGDLYVGVAIEERSAELDDTVEHGLVHVILGAYHARTAQSELDEAKKQFDLAMKINKGKLLQTQFNYAAKYYCAKSDRKTFEKMLNDVLKAGDTLPDQRLSNLIAKRKARRYLENKVFQEDCGFVD